jgi:beta-lactamase class A
MNKLLALASLLLCLSCKRQADFAQEVTALAKGKDLKVGVALIDLKTGEIKQVNGDDPFPLQSVFKYHIAAKVLEQVDKGKWQLRDQISIEPGEIYTDLYSPIRDEIGSNLSSMRLDSLIYYMVSLSDNSACDILLRHLGGPSTVNEYIKEIGIKNTKIEVNELTMQSRWEEQYRNISTPLSMAETLKKFYLREYLSGDMHDFLWALMENSPTGANRIRKGLPEGAVLAHKTGTSGRNEDGISGATNDAGIIILPDGRAYVLVVFVSDSKESDEVNEELIAKIAELIP